MANTCLHARIWKRRDLPSEMRESREQLVALSHAVARLGMTEAVEAEFNKIVALPQAELQRFIIDDMMSIES